MVLGLDFLRMLGVPNFRPTFVTLTRDAYPPDFLVVKQASLN